MRFEFVAKVEDLDYDVAARVEKQANAHLSAPDMNVDYLTIGTWRQVDGGWEARVSASVDDGRDDLEQVQPGTRAIVWPRQGDEQL